MTTAGQHVYRLDAIERVLWTAAQVVLGLISIEALEALVGQEFGAAWVPVAASLFAAIKVVVARRVGDPDSAATLPSPPDYAPGAPPDTTPQGHRQ